VLVGQAVDQRTAQVAVWIVGTPEFRPVDIQRRQRLLHYVFGQVPITGGQHRRGVHHARPTSQREVVELLVSFGQLVASFTLTPT
jgi:hypothetical protein